MTDTNRRGGSIEFQRNGKVTEIVASVTINYGRPKREGLVGPTGPQGYKELPQIAKITAEMRDSRNLDIDDILLFKDGTITVHLANGKTAMFKDSYYCGDGDYDTDEGKIQLEFEGTADEVPA